MDQTWGYGQFPLARKGKLMAMEKFHQALGEEQSEMFRALRSLTQVSNVTKKPGGGAGFGDWSTWQSQLG